MLVGASTVPVPDAAVRTRASGRPRLGEVAPVLVLARVAFLVRLVPVLRGGGLFGRSAIDQVLAKP